MTHMKDIRENMLNVLDDLVTKLSETLAVLEADHRCHDNDEAFFAEIEEIHAWIIPGFQKDVRDLLEEATKI